MSRTNKPKQFISFINNDSMFTQTVKRFSDKNVFNDVIILGNIKHEKLIDEAIDNMETIKLDNHIEILDL